MAARAHLHRLNFLQVVVHRQMKEFSNHQDELFYKIDQGNVLCTNFILISIIPIYKFNMFDIMILVCFYLF